jgi:hypothetical protein
MSVPSRSDSLHEEEALSVIQFEYVKLNLMSKHPWSPHLVLQILLSTVEDYYNYYETAAAQAMSIHMVR